MAWFAEPFWIRFTRNQAGRSRIKSPVVLGLAMLTLVLGLAWAGMVESGEPAAAGAAQLMCDEFGAYGGCMPGSGYRCKSDAVKEVGMNLAVVRSIEVIRCGRFDSGLGFYYLTHCPAGSRKSQFCIANANDGVGNAVLMRANEADH